MLLQYKAEFGMITEEEKELLEKEKKKKNKNG
jgi:hypothetical protein